MAEFTSKKLYPTVTETIPSGSTTTPLDGGSVAYEIAQKGVQCLIRGQELYQDFVTFGRSSQTKMIWIGCILTFITILAFWILVKKIGLLK